MTNQVTSADFVNSIFLPESVSGSTSFGTDYIVKYQEEILIKLLGYDLYLAYEAGLEVEPTPESKWTDLEDGSTYQINSINYRNVGTSKIVANYVYCKWLSDNWENLSSLGVFRSKQENADYVSPENKMTSAWNEMVKYYDNVCQFIYNNQDDYPNWEPETITKLTYGF